MKSQDVYSWAKEKGMTQTDLANFLKISQPAVSQWLDIIPEAQAMKLERASDGVLKYDDDVYAARRKQ